MLLLSPAHPAATEPTTLWDWATLGADHQTLLQQGSAALDACPRDGEAVLVVPPQQLSWHLLKLPKVAAQKLPKVLASLLEEATLDDTDPLHFALAPGVKAGHAGEAWVAVCQRRWLQDCLHLLQTQGFRVGRIVPALAPQPTPTAWAHGNAGETGWLSVAGPEGVLNLAIDIDQPDARPTMPALALAQALGPVSTCRTTPAACTWTAQHLGDWPWIAQTAQAQWLDGLNSQWNLAQFDLTLQAGATGRQALKQAWRHGWHAPAWRPVRWGLAGLAVVHLLGLQTAAWQERLALQRLQQDTRTALTQTFPQVQLVLDAPLQMRRELEALRQSQGELSGQDLIPVLGAVGAVNPATPVVLQQVQYSPDQLTLRHAPLDERTQAQLSDALRHLGWLPAGQTADTLTFGRAPPP